MLYVVGRDDSIVRAGLVGVVIVEVGGGGIGIFGCWWGEWMG